MYMRRKKTPRNQQPTEVRNECKYTVSAVTDCTCNLKHKIEKSKKKYKTEQFLHMSRNNETVRERMPNSLGIYG